jgi:pyridoxal phosphate enzyme (YggS family)
MKLNKILTKQKKIFDWLQLAKVKVILRLKSAYDAGQKIFGENYLQEALEKKKLLENLEIEWHFIGPIQSNKCKLISENFSWVQTVDRIKIVDKLNQYRHSKKPLNICIQVNISEENTKSGIGLDDVKEFAKIISNLKNLKLRGRYGNSIKNK